MSLAMDLLKRAGITPEKPKATRPATHFHMARVKGVIRDDGMWRAYVKGDKAATLMVGDFDSAPRALLAVRLYRHWRNKGFIHKQIPRHQTTTPYISTL